MSKIPELICALDFSDASLAKSFVEKMGSGISFYKVGLELFSAAGPAFIDYLKSENKKVFLDLKFFDIPNTVAQACAQGQSMGVDLMTLHASGGLEMLEAARSKVPVGSSVQLVAVTVLTSMSDATQLLPLANLAASAGMDALVCSVLDLDAIRFEFNKSGLGAEMAFVCPGIRLADQSSNNQSIDDQKRVATPALAKSKQANYIVVGRPLTQAEDPKIVLSRIELELNA